MKFGPMLDRLIDVDITSGNTVFLAGESAIGKSSYVKALAQRHGTQAFTMNCNLLETKEDLNGVRLVPTEDGSSYQQRFFPLRVASEAIAYAEAHPNERPILFGDELNRTSSGTVSALLTLCTDRTLGDSKIPDNLVLVFAGNVQGNISMFDEASLSRFSIYQVTPDAETFMEIHDGQLHELVVATLKEDSNRIFQRRVNDAVVVPDEDDDPYGNGASAIEFNAADAFVETEQLAQITAPRTIIALNGFLTGLDDDLLKELMATDSDQDEIDNLFAERVHGYVGKTEFAQALVAKFFTAYVGNPTTTHAGTSIPMPSSYVQLENANDVVALRQMIASLNDVVAAQCLMYALTSTRSSAPSIVVELAEKVPSLTRQQMSSLYQNNGSIQAAPLRALMGSGTALGDDTTLTALGSLVGI